MVEMQQCAECQRPSLGHGDEGCRRHVELWRWRYALDGQQRAGGRRRRRRRRLGWLYSSRYFVFRVDTRLYRLGLPDLRRDGLDERRRRRRRRDLDADGEQHLGGGGDGGRGDGGRIGNRQTLLLGRLFFEELGVSRLLVVDAALGLGPALPAAGPLVLAGGDGRGRVPVADRLVAAVQQLVVGHVVLADVGLDLGEGPIDERVDLDDAALAVELEHADLVALAALGAAAAGQHGGDAQAVEGALLRLHLGHPVVHLLGQLVQLAVRGLEVGGRVVAVGLEDVDALGRVPGPHPIDQRVRLGEVVQRVEEDDVHGLRRRRLLLDLGEHVERDEPRQPEGRRLVQVREQDLGEPQDVLGVHGLELLVLKVKVRRREADPGGGRLGLGRRRRRRQVPGLDVVERLVVDGLQLRRRLHRRRLVDGDGLHIGLHLGLACVVCGNRGAGDTVRARATVETSQGQKWLLFFLCGNYRRGRKG